MADVMGYAVGIFSASVCAAGDMTGKQAAAAFQEASPAGTSAGWQLSSEPTFRTGEPQGCSCDETPGRRHWLLEC